MRILHLEDSLPDHELVVELVKSGGWECLIHRVDTRGQFLTALCRNDVDLILADHSLPGFDGLSALRLVRERNLRIPFIFVTGSMREAEAIETFDSGATDYILKDRMSRLVPAIHRALRDARAEQREIETERRLREQAMLLEKAHDAIVVCHLDGTIRYWNQGAEQIYGWTSKEVMGKPIERVLVRAKSPLLEEARRQTLAVGKWSGDLVEFAKNGDKVIAESSWTLIETEEGEPSAILLINTDVTERRSLEEQFLRSQRMESIGILSGGIAHDLNNALAPVLLGSQLLRMQLSDPAPLKLLDSMEKSAQHGADLIRQILTFARGVEGTRIRIELAQLIDDVRRLLTDTLPRSIKVEFDIPDNLWAIQGSPTQLTQVLMNLCVNARDAMPSGGRLRIAAENFTVEETYLRLKPDAKGGAFVAISVSDTGTGIPPELIQKLYQPFFTTKEFGRGTGLGLSTVKNIVNTHDGFIHIYSEFGRGTNFKVYFPASRLSEPRGGGSPRERLPRGHGEGILVVDDEPGVLEATRLILESHGYLVLTAGNGADALHVYARRRGDIHLVLTDSMMPVMDGRSLIAALRRADPEVKIIIFSGLVEMIDPSTFENGDGIETVTKPFSAEKLLGAVDRLLCGVQGASGL